MPILKEFRIPMPLTLEEYQVGQLYSVLHSAKNETAGNMAIEMLENHPFNDPDLGSGQFSRKIYHISNRLPKIIQALAPSSALMAEEMAWNTYPKCKTVITNPFLGVRFEINIRTVHLNDAGETENAFNLTKEELKNRKVTFLDIGTDELENSEEQAQLDLSSYRSHRTGRGPLEQGWKDEAKPIMCAYKLVYIKFHVFGIQNKIEQLLIKTEHEIFLKFHKQVFVLLDEWHHLSLADIRKMECQVKVEIDQKLSIGFGYEGQGVSQLFYEGSS